MIRTVKFQIAIPKHLEKYVLLVYYIKDFCYAYKTTNKKTDVCKLKKYDKLIELKYKISWKG